MKKIFTPLVMVSMIFSGTMSYAQYQRCGTDQYMAEQIKNDPGYAERMKALDEFSREWIKNNPQEKTGSIVTIPTVFHILYANANQNIPDARIFAQLDVMNDDYRRMNADTINTPSVFNSVKADTEIMFCLAQRDPNNNPTTGIHRVSTTVSSFSSNDAMKFTAQGGTDIWDRNKYLNIWVCNLGGGLLGYATFPGGPASTDGVVCLYSSIGGPSSPGTANPYHLGRTATHEVGHWLNLHHTFNGGCSGLTANTCASQGDQVCDTPPDQTSTFGCPGNSPNTCTESSPFPPPYTMNMIDMIQNYMDYTDDACMNIFTLGQKTRMNNALNGSRLSIKTSNGCVPVGIETLTNDEYFKLYPNPSVGILKLEIRFDRPEDLTVEVTNLIGEQIGLYNYEETKGGIFDFDLSRQPAGTYIVRIRTEEETFVRKIDLKK